MNKKTYFKIGDYVKKNSDNWIVNDFDSWGRGVGIGEIITPPYELEENEVDVRWPGGRCFETVDQLLPADKSEFDEQKVLEKDD